MLRLSSIKHSSKNNKWNVMHSHIHHFQITLSSEHLYLPSPVSVFCQKIMGFQNSTCTYSWNHIMIHQDKMLGMMNSENVAKAAAEIQSKFHFNCILLIQFLLTKLIFLFWKEGIFFQNQFTKHCFILVFLSILLTWSSLCMVSHFTSTYHNKIR